MIELVPTTDAWVAAALLDLDGRARLLLDHAHCEKKAAGMALRHIDRHASWPRLGERLSRLAREELVHFERVLAELRARGMPFRPMPAAGYGATLFAAVRPGSVERPAERIVDEMICCALIEARSHERFVRLAAALEGTRVGSLYADLCEAEARHGDLYLDLAHEAAGEGIGIGERLAILTAHEGQTVARPGLGLRMHAGPR